MDRLAALDALFQDLGPADEQVDAVTRVDPGSWAVLLDDGSVLWFKAEPERAVLVLSADVGELQAGARAAVCETLLAFNALWDELGPLRMAVAGDMVVQVFDLPAVDLPLDRLRAAMQAFVDRLRLWRTVLSTPDTPTAPPALFEAMRV
jgi:hypothetical protein